VRLDPVRAPKARDPENPPGLEKGLSFQYFEGAWDRLPDFDAFKPAASGITEQFDLSQRKRDQQYGLRFTGFIEIPREGSYRFIIKSQESSRLLIGKEEVAVGSDVLLKAGKHAITLCFVQKSAEGSLEVLWEGPDVPKQKVPATALSHTRAR
jgi:hypothetical protein